MEQNTIDQVSPHKHVCIQVRVCGVNINARVTTFSENTSSNCSKRRGECCVTEKVFEKKHDTKGPLRLEMNSSGEVRQDD